MQNCFSGLIIFLLSVSITQAQKLNPDSLIKLLVKTKVTEKPSLLNKISYYYLNENPDSSLHYALLAKKASAGLKNIEEETVAISTIGRVYLVKGNYEKALENFRSLQNKATEHHLIQKLTGAFNGQGIVYKSWGKYEKALDCFFKALRLAENQKDEETSAPLLMNIGNSYRNLKKYSYCEQYLLQAMDVYRKFSDTVGIADVHNNLGLMYAETGDKEKAIKSYIQSLEACKRLNDVPGLANVNNNIGDLYADWNKPGEAIQYYEKSISYEKELGNNMGVAISYYSIGNIYHSRKNYKKALEYCNKSLELAGNSDALGFMKDLYEVIYKSEFAMGNNKKAIADLEKYMTLKDSVFNSESNNQVVEMQTKYETEKTEKENVILKNKQEIMAISARKEILIRYSLIAIAVLFCILIFFILKAYQLKKNANITLTEKNTELQQQKEEISAQRDQLTVMNEQLQQQKEEITTQRDEIEKHRDEISEQKKDIEDSIIYARKIQQALLPTDGILKSNLAESFIIYQPRDIVSGDFYWCNKINKYLVIAVADCTGHGVPGAFMSMLGIAFLNEIVRRDEVTQANHVLNLLRQNVILSLGQKGFYSDQKDGMDMTLCVINMNNLEMQFAGANNPIYIVQTGQCPVCTIQELRPDKMPIAYFIKMESFTNHIIQLNKGDTIYMFTDGICDQFGGPKGKKLYASGFRQLIKSSHDQTLLIQKNIIETTLQSWTNPLKSVIPKYEQTDDITVIGMRI